MRRSSSNRSLGVSIWICNDGEGGLGDGTTLLACGVEHLVVLGDDNACSWIGHGMSQVHDGTTRCDASW